MIQKHCSNDCAEFAWVSAYKTDGWLGFHSILTQIATISCLK